MLETSQGINSSVRKINAKVEMYNSTLALEKQFTNNDSIKSFTIERVMEDSKFFGFGICQKLNLHLIDIRRNLNLTTKESLKVFINEISSYPSFYISEVRRDERTNELSVIAYDLLYKASEHKVNEIDLQSYTLNEIGAACASIIGAKAIKWVNVPTVDINISYPNGANFEGSENLREVLNQLSEVTQTVYYLDKDNNLIFKRLDIKGQKVLSIGKEDYFELNSKTNRKLTRIVSVTELGDNVEAKLATSGTTQVIRDNSFWNLREDISDLVNKALTNVGGLLINQFECEWRGNPSLEIGDKITLQTKDNTEVITYLLNDTITYDGSFKQNSSWKYVNEESEEGNPTSLGEAIKETYAKVDKANKEIKMVASQTDANSTALSTLKINTDSVSASVSKLINEVDRRTSEVNDSIAALNESVSTKLDSKNLTIEIQKEIANAEIDKVTTSTGFTFNQDGLKVNKSNSEMATTITEDGMKVYRNNDEVLVANNQGVDAINLHATTYLMIGTNARFEDYGENRVGCFYIGRHN